MRSTCLSARWFRSYFIPVHILSILCWRQLTMLVIILQYSSVLNIIWINSYATKIQKWIPLSDLFKKIWNKENLCRTWTYTNWYFTSIESRKKVISAKFWSVFYPFSRNPLIIQNLIQPSNRFPRLKLGKVHGN